MTMRSRTTVTLITGILLSAAAISSQNMTDWAGQVFPPDHALNMPIDSLPVHTNSNNFINTMGANTSLHPDFGTSWEDNGTKYQMGIPYNLVGAGQPKVPIEFYLYNDESDSGPWPIPKNPFIETVFDWRNETDGDRHMLIIDTSAHILYETGNVLGNSDGTSWRGGCGAIFDLNGYTLRPETWTSSDAAGLPIFPLLIRYDEVERALAVSGEIHHAIRFTVQQSQKAYIWPARHYAASSTDQNRAPMGLRVRLKASVDISDYSPRIQVILRTMKKYGMIVADNGSNWYFQGTHDDRWDDEEINSLKKLHGNNFEVVDITGWTKREGFDRNSAKVPPASGQPVRTSIQSVNHQTSMLTVRHDISRSQLHVTLALPYTGNVTFEAFELTGERLTLPSTMFHTDCETSDIVIPLSLMSGKTMMLLRCTTDRGDRVYCTVPAVY